VPELRFCTFNILSLIYQKKIKIKKPPHVASLRRLNDTVPTPQPLQTSLITSSQDTEATNQEPKKLKNKEIQHKEVTRRTRTHHKERGRCIEEQIKLKYSITMASLS
jgi:hypothetical protein